MDLPQPQQVPFNGVNKRTKNKDLRHKRAKKDMRRKRAKKDMRRKRAKKDMSRKRAKENSVDQNKYIGEISSEVTIFERCLSSNQQFQTNDFDVHSEIETDSVDLEEDGLIFVQQITPEVKMYKLDAHYSELWSLNRRENSTNFNRALRAMYRFLSSQLANTGQQL